MTSSDNNKYIGYFKDNRKHGIVIIHYNKGKIAIEEWNNGILVSSKILKEDELTNLKKEIFEILEKEKHFEDNKISENDSNYFVFFNLKFFFYFF